MCDQTEVSYLENDVVWVKIGPIWWPGVVKDLEKDDEGREILAGLKKKPIAAVKFFQEDNYEFVKNLDHIYHYNCRRKDEFIKKGLDKFRTGATHMKKFPADVTTAESLVNGDVNIVNDPKFYPEKRQSYSEIFGSGKKKSKKEGETHSKAKLNTSSASTPIRPITHQRFINKVLHGESDHKVKTLIQPTSSPDDISRGLYRCHMCRFETARVNVIVAHHRLAHSSNSSINWTGSETKAARRKPIYKSRKSKNKKLFESSRTDSSDDEYLDKKKIKIKGEKTKTQSKNKNRSVVSRKGCSVTPRKRKISEDAAEDSQKKPRYTDVLLADWSEEDEDENKADKSRLSGRGDDRGDENPTEKLIDSVDISGKNEFKESNMGKEDSKNQSEKMSCFDFDEEEEGFIGMSNANTYGRKIPRVIPMKDKTELGVDMEIGELFKRKNEGDADTLKNSVSDSADDDVETKKIEKEGPDECTQIELQDKVEEKTKEIDTEGKTEKVLRRRRKSSKDLETKVDEESLAVRRTRRPGAKKSYLNEVIEKVEDIVSSVPVDKIDEQTAPVSKGSDVQNIVDRKGGKDDVPILSSSKRKQDLKLQAMENTLEENVYSDIVNNEAKSTENTGSFDKKARGQTQQAKTVGNDDLTQKIDHLLAETTIPNLPEIPGESKADSDNTNSEIPKSSNTINFSFDYKPCESSEKTEKTRTEVKSITKMFSDTIKGSENIDDKDRSSSKTSGNSSDGLLSRQGPETEGKGAQSKNLLIGGVKILTSQGPSIQLAAGPSTVILHEIDETGQQRGNSSTEGNCTTTTGINPDVKGPAGNVKEIAGNLSDGPEKAVKAKNIKTLKLKADSLPSTLLSSAGKLKGQTIIHQKGGTYVILSQPPQIPRQKISTAKGQSSSKFVILTNQLGEQKIITTSGLQQSKFKIDPQKSVVVSPSGGNSASDPNAASGIISVGKTQPVIKMVPDGKGGVVKHLTVSPKKVLVGGTKVLVSGAGTTFSTQGNTIQKIALTTGNNLSGDYRLIENYKGSGKTVLIHGGSNTSSSVLLKTSPGLQRHTSGDAVQSSPNILGVKKKPKILMRATPPQNEYVVQTEVTSAESPTYVMKRKGADGKFSTQKIIRRPLVNPAKTKSPGSSKTIILSSEQPLQKAESLIITTNHESETNKIIRLTQKVRDSEIRPQFTQKIIQKAPEAFAMSEDNILTSAETEEQEMKNDSAQILQVAQNQSQQSILQTQVMAMPGPIGTDGNQTYVLVSVDEHGVVQPVDNSLIAYDASGQSEAVFMNQNSNNNVIVISPQANEDIKPVFSNGSQDILAEALANTNVLEGNMNSDMEAVMPSILLPPSIPSSVVQETSITLQKPIMTPLEMPTSVAPDTSGLEPPPLPPTPTEEDVLLEDQEADLHETSGIREEGLIAGEKVKEQSLHKKRECLTQTNLSTDQSYKVNDGMEEELSQEKSGINYGESKEGKTEDQSQVTIPIQYKEENLQEEHGPGSLQSMPLLNDEPDTSDEAQTSEQMVNQDFETQKSRSKAEGSSPTLREQEPPSSTNNEVMMESNIEKAKPESVTSCGAYHSALQETAGDGDSRITDTEKIQEDPKMKELIENREMQSMPVITDDGNVNSYNFGQMYVDALSQKRFQEETEVTSTTDEFSNKDNIA